MDETDKLAQWFSAQLDADEQRFTGSGDPCAAERLADVRAKRSILNKIVPEATSLDFSVDQEFSTAPRDPDVDPYLGDALLTVMAPAYAGRSGYREQWRPTRDYA